MRWLALAATIATLIAAPVASGSGKQRKPAPITRTSYALANRCFALRAAQTGRFVSATATGYATGGVATPLYLKPTGLGTFLLYDPTGGMISANLSRTTVAGPSSEWAITAPVRRGGAFVLRSTLTGALLATSPATGALSASFVVARNHKTWFAFSPASGCTPFPEAAVDAGGRTFRGRVYGFVDTDLELTGDLRDGGEVLYGEAFDRFGIAAALGRDAQVHGSAGRLDLTGNLLRAGLPLGTHDTRGWPSFRGWPAYDTLTHQQVYYVWLERAWEAGERLVVAQTGADDALCRVEPRGHGGCDELRSTEVQIARLHALQDYVDAQSGGPGRGFFRLVYSPARARQVIRSGKLAVVIGVKSSDPFGCGERQGRPQCTRAQIDRGIGVLKTLGVSGMFVADGIDNAFAGAALESGAKGMLLNIVNRLQTGAYFKAGACPDVGQGVELQTLSHTLLQALASFFPALGSVAAHSMPAYPARPRCNPHGLTALGRYLIGRLIAQHMLIDAGGLSETARAEVLSLAEHAHYPLIASQVGRWTPAELGRLYRLGGFAGVAPGQAPMLAAEITALERVRSRSFHFGVGLATDADGLAALPGPRPDATLDPLLYPFRSFDGGVTFARQQTGTRVFDLNTDGVAHYGLLADLLADVQQGGGRGVLSLLFSSADAYLGAWQRAVDHR